MRAHQRTLKDDVRIRAYTLRDKRSMFRSSEPDEFWIEIIRVTAKHQLVLASLKYESEEHCMAVYNQMVG